jgi:hypothetical protein
MIHPWKESRFCSAQKAEGSRETAKGADFVED